MIDISHKLKSYSVKIITIFLVLVTIFSLLPSHFVSAQTVDPEKAALEKQLAELEAEIKEQEAILGSQKVKSASLQRDVEILRAEINKAKSRIKAREIEIQSLSGEITKKEKTIITLNSTMEERRQALGELVRRTNEFDQTGFVYAILSQDSISDFYGTLDSLTTIKGEIHGEVQYIKTEKKETEDLKEDLQDKRSQEIDKKKEIETEQRRVDENRKEQEKLLAASKQQEQVYLSIIEDRKARVSQIRAALIKFEGSGIESRSISFGEAYDFAKSASAKTGVRPALILAIMQQETNFGNNVGGCYVTDLTTGDGIGINSGTSYEKVMGSGSLPHFERITKGLGRDWKTTPVSCPIDILKKGTATKYYSGRGFGGAMGYTQFIPSTWVLVEERVRQYVGVSTANPWNPQHAVFATGVFLRDLGAHSQTYTAEYNAACRYYGACSSYGTSVMKRVENIQKMIDELERLNI